MKLTDSLSRLTAYAVIVAMLAGNVSPAYATTPITIDNSGSGTNTWTSGNATTSGLYATKTGDSRNYTDWVQSPLDDTVTMNGGSLTTSGLYQNGALYANSGNISVSSGSLHIASGSYIDSSVNLNLGSSATLVQTGGNVYMGSGDSINGIITTGTGGNLYFTGGTHTIKNGSNIANSLSITGGTVTFANADSLNTSLANSASVSFNGGTLDNNITDTGYTTFNNTVTNTASIQQNNVTNNGTLTNNGTITAGLANNTNSAILGNGSIVAGTGTSVNNGTITQNSLTNNGTFTSNGQITLTNGLTNNSYATFNNNALLSATVNNKANAIFNSDPDNLGKDVANNGTLNLNADGTLSVDVTGTGTTNISGNLENAGTISQKDVTVASGKVVTTDASDITATNEINNSGIIDYIGGSTANTINGTGRIVITGYVTNTGDINQSQVNNSSVFVNDGTGTVNANLVNTGSLEGTGSYTTKTGLSSNSGVIEQTNLTNKGTFDNNGHITLTGALTNNANAVFNTDASLISATNGMVNNGTVNFMTGTNAVVMTGTGTTNFHNTTGNNADITQATVTNDGKLTNNAVITANLTNTNEIIGTGSIVTGTGTSTNNGTIKQANLTNNGTFANNGEMTLTGTLTNNATFNNNDMLQASVNNALGATLNSAPDDLGKNVVNDGTLNLNEAGTLAAAAAVTGTGTTNINANITNNATMAQGTVVVSAASTLDNNAAITAAINNSGIINSVADNLDGAVTNSNTLNIAGGNTKGAVSGSGNMNITADLVANHTIAQGNVVNDASLTNHSTITATNITNNGTITGAASGLVGAVSNAGKLVFDADSTGTSNISGTGNVEVFSTTTLTGTNTYTGGTQINGGGLLVVDGQNNLGTGDVSFTGVSGLQVKNAGTLTSKLLGVNATTDTVAVINDNALTLNGTIDNATDFYKGGAGTMTLGMASNTYTGDTYVTGGTLVGNTQNINKAVHGLATTTTIEFNDTTDAQLNEIDTIGNFVQSGSAVLNVQNNAFSAKRVDINAGTFAANRALTATTLNVNGGTLRGNGNITGTVNVNSGATIAPGNSIDTLTVTGNLNLASGSTTAIEMNETSSDKIVVTGATNIASGANLTVTNEGGRFFDWESFDILESSNVAGTFTYDGTISNFDTSRIDVTLDYSDPTKVTLTAKRKATNYAAAPVVALPRNASQAARAMDAISTGFGGDITNALLQLEQLGGLNPDGVALINPNATLTSALNDLGGVLYANSALIPLLNAKTTQVYDRIAQRSGAEKKCVYCANNVWVQYYNQHDKVFTSNNSPRFTNDMSGALVGYDRTLGDFLVGAYAGFGKNDLRQYDDSKMDLEDTTFGLYSGYTLGDWAFSGTLFAGAQNYHGKRYISFMNRTADGKYNGSNVGLDLEASYNIPVYSWLNVKPFAGWLNLYTHQQAFTEKDAGALNLHVNSNDQFNSQARLGVRVDGQIKNRLSWYGSVAVKQFVGDDYAKLRMDLGLPNTNMQIISAELGRTSFGGQVGANYALTNNWSVFANVEGNIDDKAANCYGNVGVAYTW